MESKFKSEGNPKRLRYKIYLCAMLKSWSSMTSVVISRSFWCFVGESFPTTIWKALITNSKFTLQPA